MQRYLVVNADDFGLHPGINQGVALALKKGVVKNASFITNTPYFDESLALLRKNPALSVGVHLNLTDGKPLADSTHLRFLLDNEGSFPGNHVRTVRAIMTHPLRLHPIEEEFRLQIGRLKDCGIRISHLDSHGHIHILPPLFGFVTELAAKFRIPFIRIPKEKVSLRDCFSRWDILGVNLFSSYVLARSGRRSRHLDHFIGMRYAGRVTKEVLLRMIDRLDYGTNEIGVHPGFDPGALSKQFAWNYSWQDELLALTDEEVKESIERRGVRCVSFEELEEMKAKDR